MRQNLEDYNSERSGTFGQWIFPDRPMITKLMNNKNNFPRISVETLNMPTIEDIGMGSSEQVQIASLKINVWSVRDLICSVTTTIDESHQYNTGTDIYELDSLPFSDITTVVGTRGGVSYVFVKNTDYNPIDDDGDGFRDSIEWIADTPDDGTNFLVTYKRNASSSELCRIIAQDINKYLRDNWRNWPDRKFWGYQLRSSNPVDFDERINVFKYEMTVQFTGTNIGDEI